MRSRQAGVTFIGWVVLLIPLAIVAFAGIKLSTLYMNNFKVAKVLEQTAKSSDAATATPAARAPGGRAPLRHRGHRGAHAG